MRQSNLKPPLPNSFPFYLFSLFFFRAPLCRVARVRPFVTFGTFETRKRLLQQPLYSTVHHWSHSSITYFHSLFFLIQLFACLRECSPLATRHSSLATLHFHCQTRTFPVLRCWFCPISPFHVLKVCCWLDLSLGVYSHSSNFWKTSQSILIVPSRSLSIPVKITSFFPISASCLVFKGGAMRREWWHKRRHNSMTFALAFLYIFLSLSFRAVRHC